MKNKEIEVLNKDELTNLITDISIKKIKKLKKS